MSISRNLPSQTLEELMASIMVNPTEPDTIGDKDNEQLAEVSEVAALPEVVGDASTFTFIQPQNMTSDDS